MADRVTHVCRYCFRNVELRPDRTVWTLPGTSSSHCHAAPANADGSKLHRPRLPSFDDPAWVDAWLADEPYTPPRRKGLSRFAIAA